MIRWLLIVLFSNLVAPLSVASGLPDGPYLSTSAEAAEKVDPDYAVLNLRFKTIEPSAEVARQRTNEAQQILAAILEEYSDALKSHQVNSLLFGEELDYDGERHRRVSVGFFGSFDVELEVHDFDELKTLHYELAGLEWDQLSSPRFAVEDHERFERIVRSRALEKANEKARELAKVQGATLGSIWGILHEPLHDLAGRSPGVVDQANIRMQPPAMSISFAEFALPVEPRPIVFEARVGVVFELIPSRDAVE